MRLILASDMSFLLKHGYALTGIPDDQMRVGYVTTASKGARDQAFFQRIKDLMQEKKIPFEEIDIEGKSKDELLSFFKDKNIIHIEGGNTFYLLRAIKENNFAEVLKELLYQGKVYIGTSAGAYIMCPSIEVSNWDKSGRDRFGLSDFSALQYVPFLLKVHYNDEKESEVRENIKAIKYPIRILRDGEGLLCENGECKFIGDAKETILI